MDERPTVSVIVPSLNQGDFIGETINSILSQSYRPIELIVVDGGSTDNTLEVLHDFGDEIMWISEPDEGQAVAVNKGFSLARGDIVGWLNSDDVYFYKNSVETVTSVFEDYQEVDVIYGDAALISRGSILLRLKIWPDYDQDRILRSNMMSQPATFFRRRVVQEESLNNELICLDYEYWLRLACKGYCFQHIGKIIAGDRHHADRLSERRASKLSKCVTEIRSKYGWEATGASQFLALMDKFTLVECRLKGINEAIRLIRQTDLDATLAFPGQIDRGWNLLYRQAVMNHRRVKEKWRL